MNIELWREINNMVKYKAEKDHTHGFTIGVIIFLFFSILGLSSERIELEARVAQLEQRAGIENAGQ